jgi:hypothetical protein
MLCGTSEAVNDKVKEGKPSILGRVILILAPQFVQFSDGLGRGKEANPLPSRQSAPFRLQSVIQADTIEYSTLLRQPELKAGFSKVLLISPINPPLAIAL